MTVSPDSSTTGHAAHLHTRLTPTGNSTTRTRLAPVVLPPVCSRCPVAARIAPYNAGQDVHRQRAACRQWALIRCFHRIPGTVIALTGVAMTALSATPAHTAPHRPMNIAPVRL